MKTEKVLKYKGKEVSYLLRHKENFTDKHGYAPVSSVLERTFLTKEELDWIVDNNNKKRFEYNEDKTLIRARQGHSHNVDVGLEKIPAERVPFRLYHGTPYEKQMVISEKGLLKMKRQHVHMSEDWDTAEDVGSRYTKGKKPMILKIQAKLMAIEGYEIYKSNNGVWLTDHVPPKYIEFPND